MATKEKSSINSELRILLVGRTGHGKSTTCNTLIGANVAGVSSASTSTTSKCRLYTADNRFNRNLQVVDTPGIFDTANDNEAIHKELVRSLLLTVPGFHAIAFVLKRDKFTAEMQETKDIFFKWFGENVKKHSFVILTDTNTTEEMNEYLHERPHKKLTELVNDCGGRVVPLQNNCKNDSSTCKQVRGIFRIVDKIIAKNELFSNAAYTLASFYAEKKSLPKSILNLLSRKTLPKIQNETVSHIVKPHLETSSGSDVIEETKSNMAKPDRCSYGNLKIIDAHTDKPYGISEDTLHKSTSDVTVISEEQTSMTNFASWDFSASEEGINEIQTSFKDDTSTYYTGSVDTIKELELPMKDVTSSDFSASEDNINEKYTPFKDITSSGSSDSEDNINKKHTFVTERSTDSTYKAFQAAVNTDENDEDDTSSYSFCSEDANEELEMPIKDVTSSDSSDSEDDINEKYTPFKDITSSGSSDSEDNINTKHTFVTKRSTDSTYKAFRAAVNTDENDDQINGFAAWVREQFSKLRQCTII